MTTAQWVNTGPDEAALPALLGRIAQHIPVDSIDELWIFPTRRAQGVESTVIVVSAFCSSPQDAVTGTGADVGTGAADQQDRRRVNTAHFTATRDRKGHATVEEKIELHAVAPADAAGRVVEGVIRRLDDNLALPRSERIAGDATRWAALLQTLDTPQTSPLTPAGGG